MVCVKEIGGWFSLVCVKEIAPHRGILCVKEIPGYVFDWFASRR